MLRRGIASVGLAVVAVAATASPQEQGAIRNWKAPVTWEAPNAAELTAPLQFIGITPCRLIDTRGFGFTGAWGPPFLTAGVARNFPIAGQCGIPANAPAVSANLGAARTQSPGHLSVYPQGGAMPVVSSLNYAGGGQMIANAAVITLGTGGGITVVAGVGSTDFFMDVNGYYAPENVVTSLNGLTGDVDLAAGDNISLTPSGNSIVIAASMVPGPVGPQGPQGPAGAQGDVGPAGSQGPAGAQGDVGPAGTQGPAGAQGDVGPAGPQGPAGAQGDVGPAGPQGPAGAQGNVGPIGPQGPAGAQGDVGPAGPQGSTGAQGDVGPVGPQGPAGAQGDVGPAGPQGSTGAQGDVGPVGPAGAQGDVGPAGPQGSTGAQGDVGPVGPAGAQGDVGPAGPQGPTGAQGDVGPAGAQGDVGPAGPQGPTGAQGGVGPVGPQGSTGPQGATGPQGPQGPAGPTGGGSLIGGAYGNAGNGDFLQPWSNVTGASSQESQNSITVSAGTASTLVVTLITPPGTSVTVTLRKNFVDTALTCTITSAAQTCKDGTHTVLFADNDILSLRWNEVAATNVAPKVAFKFAID